MSDDFDDELYNVYNGAKEDSYANADIYADDYKEHANTSPKPVQGQGEFVDPHKPDVTLKHEYQQDASEPPPQEEEYSTMMQNWGFQANSFPYNAYRNFPPMSNPYQVQQMMQRQIRQQSSPAYEETGQNRTPSVASAANQDEGKMFVGGLNWETTDDSLRQYFAQFGEVADCVVMRDPATGRSRGFGFLTMLDTNVVDTIVNQDHYLDGKRIDPKRAIPREEQEKTEKIFVGGISADVDEEEFREFFTQFGKVTDATLMTDRDTGRPRGFGFITFESSNGVDEALRHPDLSIKGKLIEVKKAMPKSKQLRNAPGGFAPNFSAGGGGRGGYMPNSRYAGAAYGNPVGAGRGYGFNNMYNVYGGGYGNYNMAAAYYGRAPYMPNAHGYYGRANNPNYGLGEQQYREGEEYREEEDKARGDERRFSREARERPPYGAGRSYGGEIPAAGTSAGGSGGGALHASQASRNQHQYRPY